MTVHGRSANSANVGFSRGRQAATGRLRKFGGCDLAGIQGCISHDESLVLVYSTAQRSTELGSHELRTAEPGQTLRTKCVALSTKCFVRRTECSWFVRRTEFWDRVLRMSIATDDARTSRVAIVWRSSYVYEVTSYKCLVPRIRTKS